MSSNYRRNTHASLLFVFENSKSISFLKHMNSGCCTLNWLILLIFRYRLSSYTSCQNVKKGKSPYSNCSWLRKRLTGKDGEVWRRARIYQLLNKHYSKKLSWFNVDWLLSSVKSSNNKKNCSVECVSSSKINCCERLTWTDDEYRSLQILLNSIVNQWQPHLMDEDQNYIESDLHSTLTPKRLKPVRIIYG